VPGGGFLFVLFDFRTVGSPGTDVGLLKSWPPNPSGLPKNDFRVTVPLTFGRNLLGVPHAGFRVHTVLAGETLAGLAASTYRDANLWPRLFTANRDTVSGRRRFGRRLLPAS